MKVKRLILLLGSIYLVLVFALMVFISGCTNDTLAPTATTTITTPTSTALPASTTSSQVIKLKFACMHPPTAGPTQEGNMFIDLLSQNSGGRIQVTMYPSESLGKAASSIEMLKNGICDITVLPTPYFPDRFTLQPGLDLPLNKIENWVDATWIKEEVLNTFTDFPGFEDLKFLAFLTERPQNFFLKKQVLKLEDLKGMKIRPVAADWLKPFESVGLSNVTMTMADVYQALERGILDGAVNAPEQAIVNKWQEVLKYCIINPPITYGAMYMVMNKNTWDNFLADIKLIFQESLIQWRYNSFKYFQDIEDNVYSELEKNGVTLYKLDPAETERWVQLAAPQADEWIAQKQSQGLPAKEMMELFNRIIQRYNK